MLDSFDWTPKRGKPHPLLSSAVLHKWIPVLDERACSRALQAMTSASNAASRKSPNHANGRRASTASIARSSGADLIPKTHKPPVPDDAAENPSYNPCPNKRHLESNNPGQHLATKRLFLNAAEERLEWVIICNQANLPIRWIGCSPGCLAFLEQEDVGGSDDELWGLSEEEDD
jgi:hypothetical protein